MSRQGIVGKIWRNIKHTIRVTRTPETCVGQDENGTKFYERVPDQAKGVKPLRRIEAADGDTWNAPEVSPEWLAWLRYKRDDPPSPEEIEKNRIQSLRVQRRAMELERARQGEKSTERLNLNPPKPNESNRRPFPKYEDYEAEQADSKKS